MESNAYRTARLCLLRENGAVEDMDGVAANLAPGQTLVLSRAWCRFRLYRAAAGLSKSQIARAARLHAEEHAPFPESGTLLLRTPQGVAIWYWDMERIAATNPRVGAPVGACAPETLYRPAGEGWRIVECVEGLEAQYWEDGGLVASSWRRGAFTQAQWAAFVLGVENARIEAPDQSPEPAYSPLQPDARWRGQLVRDPLSWRDGETIALGVTLLSLGVAAFFAGQGAQFESRTDASRKRVVEIEALTEADPATRMVRERLALIRDYTTTMNHADVLAASADAFEVFERAELDAQDWSIDQKHFRATLNAAAAESALREIVSDLENTPSLAHVAPQFPGRDLGQDGAIELSADVIAPAATPERRP